MINAESVGQAVDPSTVSTTMESVEGTEDPETSVTGRAICYEAPTISAS